jgi:bleomycin hydrolase
MGAENSKPQVKKQTYDEKEISPSQSISYIQESLSTLNLSDEEIRVRYAPVTGEDIRKYARSFSQDNKNLLAMNAVAGNNPTNVLLNPRAALKDEHVFNIKLDIEGAATNQKSSGRCWLFAGTNVMRLAAINRLKLKDDFELSQSYLFFYDKFEKANWFLENMLDLANTDINDRVVQYLLADPVGDGGQWVRGKPI